METPSDSAPGPPSAPEPDHPPEGRRWGIGRAALIGFALVAAGAAAYGLYWNYAADRFRSGIDAWARARAAEGYRVNLGAVDIAGFPFRIEATVADPALAGTAGAGPWSWRGPALTIRARPWRPSRMRITAPGRHRIEALVAGGARAFSVGVRALALKLRLPGGKLARASLSARGVDVTDEAGARLGGLAAAAVIIDRPGKPVPGAEGPPPAMDLLVEADGVRLAHEPAPGLGTETARIGLRASVTGALPLAPSAAALVRWRDAGGTVEVRAVGVRHGPIRAEGDGTLALDDAMQPIGAFTLRLRGFAEAIDALRLAGAVEPRPAELAKAALGALAKRGSDGAATLTAPVSIQNRRLYVGPVALARLPRVRWE